MASSIESVGSFSVVLAEAFAAVGLSTLVPALCVAALRHAGSDPPPSDGAAKAPPGVKVAMEMIQSMAKSIDGLDLLIPKTARIEADFELEANAAVSGAVGVGAMLNVVSVSAGYSALYESKSKNKVHLEVDFATVHVPISGPRLPDSTAVTTNTTNTTSTTTDTPGS